jgi:hypothetical protein
MQRTPRLWHQGRARVAQQIGEAAWLLSTVTTETHRRSPAGAAARRKKRAEYTEYIGAMLTREVAAK